MQRASEVSSMWWWASKGVGVARAPEEHDSVAAERIPKIVVDVLGFRCFRDGHMSRRDPVGVEVEMADPILEVTSDIACGSLGHVERLGPWRVGIEVQSSRVHGLQGSLEVWVAGLVRADQPGILELVVTNEHGNMRYLRPVFSRGDDRWEHVETYGYSADPSQGHFSFHVPVRPDAPTRFATWWPYSFEQHTTLIAEIQGRAAARIREIGRSTAGRPIRAIEVGGVSGSPTLVVTGGIHGAETTAMVAADAIARFLVSPDAEEIRRSVRCVVVPLVNVDAQADGLDRRSASGLNLWLDAGAANEPEIRALEAMLEAEQPTVYIDLHSWHWGGDGCYMPGWMLIDDAAYDQVLALRGAIEARFPMTEQIFMSDDEAVWMTRVALRTRAPAITVEMSLGRGTDGVWKTPARIAEDARQILLGTVDYLLRSEQ